MTFEPIDWNDEDEQQPADVVTAEQQQDGAAGDRGSVRAASLLAFLDLHRERRGHDVIASLAVGDGRTVELTQVQLSAVLAERTALAAQVAELKSEREVGVRAVESMLRAMTGTERYAAAQELYHCFADRIEALNARAESATVPTYRGVACWPPIAAPDGLSATAKERIGACMEAKIRPAMLANLPDAYLRGKLGTERINKWADWISATLTACLNGDGTGEALEAPLPQYKREPKAATTERVPCAFCGSPMTRSLARPSKKYCSDLCNKRDFDARSGVRTAGLTSRARNGGFTIIEEVDPDVVFERDRGICYLCDQPVDRGAGLTAEGPTVDHVIPTSKGGVHSYANVKLTHRRCNSRKNNRIIDIIGFELRDQPSVTPNDTNGADR